MIEIEQQGTFTIGTIEQAAKHILRAERPYPYARVHTAQYSVSQIMGYLKGKSGLMIFVKYANMKYKYGNRHFWRRGYYVDTVGRNKKVIEQYIRNQLQQDYEEEQLSIKEFVDPFTGQPVKEGK